MYAYARDLQHLRRRRPAAPWRRPLRRLAMGGAVFLVTVFALAETVHGSTPGGYVTISVASGDSVWSIASERYPRADTREKVDEILHANGLRTPDIQAGEKLKVPAG